MNACTIIAKNYLAFARVLATSFREHHPDGRFTVLVLDDIDGHFDPADEPFDVMSPEDIGLPEFHQMAGAYDVLELSTAVKPWLLRRLLDDADHAVYLDPDIRIYAPCDHVAELAVEHGIVLTPHNVAAMPRDGKKPSETDILVAGAYNLGFIGLGRSHDTLEFLDWWGERLRTDCIVDVEHGYFVDQRWIDLVPGMVPSFALLRDPAYNVAYWNLHSRPMAMDGNGFTVNGEPLRFFHFSGYDPRSPQQLSRHQNRIDLPDAPVLRELCDAYGAELLAQGYEDAIEWPYNYTHTANDLELTRPLRRMYAGALVDGKLTRSVFDQDGARELSAYAREPSPEYADPRLTRFAVAVYEDRRDLREAFPALTDIALERYLRWFDEDAPKVMGMELAKLGGAKDAAAQGRRLVTRAELSLGVNLVGYFSAELGVGETARQVAAALDTQSVPLVPIGLTASASRQGHAFAQRRDFHSPFPVNLLCANADQMPVIASLAGEAFFTDRHTIGWWWWEASDFPAQWRGSFAHVDELWAGSRFVADTLQAVSPRPVHLMPMPVALPAAVQPNRPALGLPLDAFIYLVVFDHNSVFERKNPLDAIRAYVKAFPQPRADVRLVIKTINADRHRADHDRLRYAIGDRDDVILMSDYLPAGLKNALIASCDAYVSLHRSEGFGISLAEAMLLNKPVIATDYSGPADFIHSYTAFPVPWALVPIGAGNEPYPPDGRWAQPDVDAAAAQMRLVFDDRGEGQRRAAAGAEYIRANHDPQVAGRAMAHRLEMIARERELLVPTPGDWVHDRAVNVQNLSKRGPAPMSGANLPKRAVRGMLLRASRPALNYTEELHRAMADALDETANIALWAANAAEIRAEAMALAETRRVEALIASLQAQVGAQSAAVAELRQALAQATAQLDSARTAAEAATVAAARTAPTPPAETPYVAGTPFALRDDADRGRVLGMRNGVPHHDGVRGFLDVFRGEEDLVRNALSAYLPVIGDRAPVADLGCGRGEMLDLLAERGIAAVGVELDPGCAQRAREKGHTVYEADAVAWLREQAAGTLGAITATRLAERMEPETLQALFAAARTALAPGGVLVIENTNPHSARALRLFWVDPANRQPLFPETTLELLRGAGFDDAYAFVAGGSRDYDADRVNEGAYAVVATAS